MLHAMITLLAPSALRSLLQCPPKVRQRHSGDDEPCSPQSEGAVYMWQTKLNTENSKRLWKRMRDPTNGLYTSKLTLPAVIDSR